jgi:S-DNA-T family DNA segregation ATPase FtsK/SpoIIIE
VALACIGILTLLALVSYTASDTSLNASGSTDVQNWIGPAGAYWADMLLQALGVGAYALGFGFLFAGWRAFRGRRILPGLREAAGTGLLVFSVGAFAHMLLAGSGRTYPAGGVIGAILAELLRENFAIAGAFILSGALVLASLTIATDGILSGMGLRGIGALSELALRLKAAWIVHRERRLRLRARRAELAEKRPEPGDHWTLGEMVVHQEEEPELEETTRERRRRRLSEARDRGRALGDREADREIRVAQARALRDISEPEIQIDRTVDLAAEDDFELGSLPSLNELMPLEKSPAREPTEDVIELDPDDVEIDVPIRAAEPPARLGKLDLKGNPPPDQKGQGAAAPEPPSESQRSAPKRVVGTAAARKNRTGEPEIVDVRPEVDLEALERNAAEKLDPTPRSFELPTASILDFEATAREPLQPEKLRDKATKLTKTLKEYGIEGHVREIRPGPVVTMYEFVPAPGIKLSKIAGLADDLAMSMEALRVRIVAPIPGKGAVGIEIPNDSRETVFLKEIIANDAFRKAKAKLTVALGKDIEGNAVAVNLAKMPHLLVAGATGAGKSVSINSMIMSILFKATPDEVRMIMVDPKMLELSVYDDIPHLLLPVVTDPKKASLALRWAVEEMERRYHLLSEAGVRSIDGFNQKVRAAIDAGKPLVVKGRKSGDDDITCDPIPYIVVVVDELADLMMVASREVEASIMRLAQMARAAGIHLILATQRPSVDVITGVIKANFPTRIAFQVASKHDSRTIIDANGAEHLLGHGDMLYLSPGAGGISRVHGAYVSEEEIERTTGFLKQQGNPEYDESILAPREDAGAPEADDEDKDEMYDQAIAIVAETRQASISMIQRRLRIGYNRAARMVERMETEGIVGPADGAKPREVLVPSNAI